MGLIYLQCKKEASEWFVHRKRFQSIFGAVTALINFRPSILCSEALLERYYILSRYLIHIKHDSAHITTFTLVKLWPYIWPTNDTPHLSLPGGLRGVFREIFEENGRDISRMHCAIPVSVMQWRSREGCKLKLQISTIYPAQSFNEYQEN